VKRMLKNILSALNVKERRRFSMLVMLDIFVSIIDILFLALLLWIIRFYIQPGHSGKLLVLLPGWLPDKDSILLIAIFVLLFALKNITGFMISRAYSKFINQVAIRISHNSLANYQQSAFREFVNIDSSVHLRSICFRPFEFSQYMLSGVQQIITQSSLILVAIIAILLFNAKIFLLLLLILLPPVIIVFWFIKKKLSLTKKHIQETNERSFQYLMDALKGYVESNIYDRNSFFLQRFIKSRKQFSTHLFESMSLQILPGRVIEIFAVLGLFILIVIAKWTGNNSEMLLTIGAFMAAAYKIIPGVVKIINLGGQMKGYEFSINELEQTKMPGRTTSHEKTGADLTSIELRNVNFRYANQQVLNNFSLAINKGDFVGITGRSGKGKTTILNLLLGFLPAEAGEVYVNNHPVNSNDIKKYWQHIGYVRQQGFFINDSLLRNITFEENGYNKESLDHALRISGLEKLIPAFPEGLEKRITENGRNISGGQQQRISITRALYKNAPLILLDEPFNELDEESTHTLLEHFKQLSASGKTVVMITHDKKSLSYCSKIVSLDES
jgi:ABC-type bacteriocin/lantibiotic exporter with double-glycine peptidase domain